MSPKKVERTECEVYSRVCGYMRPVKQWNDAMQEIHKDRKRFQINEDTLSS